MFRVSPWISYDPNGEAQQDHARSRAMNEDVDMDAPQISTLKEETPEPQPNPSRQSKFRVKLVVNPAPVAGPSTKKPKAHGETDEDDEDDDEEDQLIDDDDDEPRAPPPPPVVVSAPPPIEKRAAPAKRGTATGRGRGRGRGARSKLGRADSGTMINSGPGPDGLGTITIPANSISAPVPAPTRKRGGARGTGQRGGTRKRGAKTATAVPSHLRDDAGSTSERTFVNSYAQIIPYALDQTAYAGTAASSPGHEEASPEFHDLPLPSHAIPIAPAPSMEDINLEGVPLPSYPLPSKPFAVHPPPKIPSGFAPVLPLDKSGKKVRHWRQANREVRGIAGGRWFMKTWIGDKESEYASQYLVPPAIPAATQATALAMANVERDLLSPLSTVPIPRLTGSGRGRGRGGAATNPSSRAQSSGADSVSAPKRRTTTQAVDSPLSMSISTGS